MGRIVRGGSYPIEECYVDSLREKCIKDIRAAVDYMDKPWHFGDGNEKVRLSWKLEINCDYEHE